MIGLLSLVVWMGLESQRNKLKGRRWLRFFDSVPGDWAVQLAAVGVPRVAVEPAYGSLPAAAAPALPHGAPIPLEDLPAEVERTRTRVRQIRARLPASSSGASEESFERVLQDKLVEVEAMLDALLGVGVSGADASSLSAALLAAQEVCDTVERLIAGREWRP